jgi:type IV pilus assembly protein PilM
MTKLLRSRAKKRLVLDIGSSAIRLCELTQTKAGYQLTKYFRREVLVDPLLDEEAKKKIRVDALKNFLKERKIRAGRSIFAVPGRSVFTRTRTLPPVPEYKLTQIVRYEIQQQIPFALDQIALDYQILSRTDAGGYDVMMAAIKVDVVDKHIDILREARCGVDSVDVCPIAAYNWLKHMGEFGNQGECVALIDLGASTTDIVIERGNQFRFTRPLSLAGNDITSAIRDSFGMNFADAEKLKRERGFAPIGDPQRDGKLGEVIGGVLSRLVTEVSRSFAYFRSLPGGGPVERVLITGGGACMRGIIPYLQRQFGVEVRIAQPIAGLAIAPSAQEVNEHPEQTSVILGMALRGLQQVPIEINLVPPEILATARRREQLVYWVLSFITIGLIAASVIPAGETKNRLVLEQIETLRKCIDAYDPLVAKDPKSQSEFIAQLDDARKAVQFREDQLKKLENAYKDRIFYLKDLKLLNDMRPEGGKVWFTSIETTTLRPGGEGDQKKKSQDSDKRGGSLGASSMNKASGVPSSGFPSLRPTAAQVEKKGGGGGLGGGRQQANAVAAETKVAEPGKPNGYHITGYAKDPDTFMEFVKLLKEAPRFKAGVYWNEANLEQVYAWDMDEAPIDSRGGGGGNSRVSGVVDPSQGETVIRFQMDVQYGDAPAPQGSQQGGAKSGPLKRKKSDDAEDANAKPSADSGEKPKKPAADSGDR